MGTRRMNEVVPERQPAPREEAEYNRLFDILIFSHTEDEPYLVGFVSYVYYKIAKREYVDEFYKIHRRHPNEMEMRAYVAGWTDSRISGLKTEANAALSEYTSYVIEREKPKIEKAALQDRSFMRESMVAFCGAFIYSLALLAFAFILKKFDIDLIKAISP